MLRAKLAAATHLLSWLVAPAAAQSVEKVGEGDISISLTVYVSSVIATAALTWRLARVDGRRQQQIDDLAKQVDRLCSELKRSKGA